MNKSNAWIPGVFLGVAVVVAAMVAFRTGWPALKFTSISAGDLAGKLGILVLFSLIIERTLDVFLTLWRAPGSESFEAEIRQLEKDLKNRAKKAAAEDALPAKRQEFLDYKAVTQRYALPFGVVLGLLVAAFGVRALSQFLEVTPENGPDASQMKWFSFIDIMFTGALLAGGSEPLHRLMNLYRKFMDSTTTRASKP